MQRWIRPRTVAGAVLLAGALSAPAIFGFAVAAGAVPAMTTDPAGDTVTDTIEDPISVPAADIVATTAESRPDGITLAFRVTKPVDPAGDRNWLSPFTSARWELDVNGDSKRDYVVDYYRDENTSVLTADLDKSGPGHLPDDCAPKPSYSAEAGYVVVVDPKCLGGASTFTYLVRLEYTTDAEDNGADIGTDTSPDEGWAGPVTVTLAAGVTPVTLAAPITTPDQSGTDARTPTTSMRPGPDAATPPASNPTTPASGKPVSPQQVRPRSRPTNGGTSAAAPSTTTPGLARTGLGDGSLRMTGFAVGIALIGIGLLFANHRPALQTARLGWRRAGR